MATFIRKTKEEAEQCLRDFPNNWEAPAAETPNQTHYLCKTDRAIHGVISKDPHGMWFCDIFSRV